MPAHCASQDCCCQCPWPRSSPLLTTPPAEAPKHTRASLAHSLVGSLLLSPGPWCTQGLLVPPKSLCFCIPMKVLWSNPTDLQSRIPGDSQSLCWIPTLGSLLWSQEILQQCENFYCIIILQFMGHSPGGSVVGLMQPPPTELTPHTVPPRLSDRYEDRF